MKCGTAKIRVNGLYKLGVVFSAWQRYHWFPTLLYNVLWCFLYIHAMHSFISTPRSATIQVAPRQIRGQGDAAQRPRFLPTFALGLGVFHGVIFFGARKNAGGSWWNAVPIFWGEVSDAMLSCTHLCINWIPVAHPSIIPRCAHAGSSRRLDQSLYQGTWYLGRLATWRCHGDRARRDFDCDLWPLMIAKWEWKALEKYIYICIGTWKIEHKIHNSTALPDVRLSRCGLKQRSF